ncbi:Rv3654c family TadE-like protein [Herbiconiux sp. P18]|uniref:Rv3654c family TadE-like protein n=1 Tax=Herbiconiux liangxiaofengii TaxID=3342795 RepID=UPI0035B9C38F
MGLAAEDGGGSVLGVALVLAMCAAVVGFAPFGAALAAHQRLQGAADAAALAAADTSSGRLPGVPCEAAEAVAAALAVDLGSCEVAGDGTVTVTVSTSIAGLGVSAQARAGPPAPHAEAAAWPRPWVQTAAAPPEVGKGRRSPGDDQETTAST